MKFEWDENKNKENIRKHRLSFFDAIRVFEDENGLRNTTSRILHLMKSAGI